MEISGLSNQWETRHGLFDSFGSSSRGVAMRYLLLRLEAMDGPSVWGGTSHSTLNLVTRDVANYYDRIPSFVYIDAVESKSSPRKVLYRVKFRRVVGIRPTNQWVSCDVLDVDIAVSLILEALKYADSPQRNLK
ncbi:hypothetical protein [Aeoliella sp.]|uniref:hypothetical protein n=1 Tax=Aeoliella sp. TaxID=2795800 RepID=UPI003CCBBC4D